MPGDLTYVDLHKPRRIGDIVVVQCRNGSHTAEEASLGIYCKRTERQTPSASAIPPAEFALTSEHVKEIHRVLTANELFGV